MSDKKSNSNSKFLTLEDITSFPDRKDLEIEVPEWGGKVLIHSMTLAQQEPIAARMATEGYYPGLLIEILAATLKGEDGEPLGTLSQLEALKEKNGNVLNRLAMASGKLSGIIPTESEEPLIDQAVKN